MRLAPAPRIDHHGEGCVGYPVPAVRFARRWDHTLRRSLCGVRWVLRPARPRLDPVLGRPIGPRWGPGAFDGGCSRVFADAIPSRLLPASSRRIRAQSGFRPASRIDGQSLPWGRRCSPAPRGSGIAPDIGLQVVKESPPRAPSPSSCSFQDNGSHSQNRPFWTQYAECLITSKPALGRTGCETSH